jgi:heme/copper-type cytochrome/quinol oxidase subunit 1
MKINLKEVIWFLVPLVVALALVGGVGGGFTESTLDLNIHDTYFVIAPLHLYLLLVPFVGFLVFLIRSAFYRFTNTGSNISLCIYAALLVFMVILLAYGLSSIVN